MVEVPPAGSGTGNAACFDASVGLSGRLGRAADAYRHLVGARMRADLSYRTSFILRLASGAAMVCADYIAIWALMATAGSIAGWTIWQVTFLFGVSNVSFRLADAFVGGSIERVAQHVQAGTFDKFLTRPLSPLVQILGEEFAVRRVGQFVAMVPFAAVALVQLDIAWSPVTAAFVAAVVVGGALVSASIFVITACVAFWSPRTEEVANAFTYGGSTIAEYPVHALASWMRPLTFTLVPVAYMVYLPAFVLFDAPNPMGIPRWASYAAPAAGLPLCLLAAVVWRFALRRYRSTGS